MPYAAHYASVTSYPVEAPISGHRLPRRLVGVKPPERSYLVTRESSNVSSQVPQSLPLLLDGSLFDGWELQKSLLLTLEGEVDGSVILSDDIFFVYGTGNTLGDAIVDYVMALTELYSLVENDAQQGVPFGSEQLQHIQAYLRKIS